MYATFHNTFNHHTSKAFGVFLFYFYISCQPFNALWVLTASTYAHILLKLSFEWVRHFPNKNLLNNNHHHHHNSLIVHVRSSIHTFVSTLMLSWHSSPERISGYIPRLSYFLNHHIIPVYWFTFWFLNADSQVGEGLLEYSII